MGSDVMGYVTITYKGSDSDLRDVTSVGKNST